MKMNQLVTYTVYKIDLNTGKLSDKEHINGNELDDWMKQVYGEFPAVKVVLDQTKQFIIYSDNGTKWEIVKKGKE